MLHNSMAMKKPFILAALLFLGCIPLFSQQQLDAATKEDVAQLMELAGTRALIQQMWARMAQQSAVTAADAYQQKHPDATPLQLREIAESTGRYMQDVTTKIFSVDEILDVIVPIYQRHLTHADVQSIIEFYSSSAGRKMLKEMPTMMAESMQSVEPIIKKHLPEMQAAAQKAVDEAAKTAAASDPNASGTSPK